MKTILRLFKRTDVGALEDMKNELDVSQTGGCVPAVGDRIVNSGCLADLDRMEPRNRYIWTVRERVFCGPGGDEYVILVVDERVGSAADAALF